MKRDHRACSNPIATLVRAALRSPEQAHAICCNQFCGETQVGSAITAQAKSDVAAHAAAPQADTVYGDGVISVRTGIGVWERHREGGRSRLGRACPRAKLGPDGRCLNLAGPARAVHESARPLAPAVFKTLCVRLGVSTLIGLTLDAMRRRALHSAHAKSSTSDATGQPRPQIHARRAGERDRAGHRSPGPLRVTPARLVSHADRRATARRGLPARRHLPAGLPAPRRQGGELGAVGDPAARPRGAQADRAGLRARTAPERARRLGAARRAAAAGRVGASTSSPTRRSTCRTCRRST